MAEEAPVEGQPTDIHFDDGSGTTENQAQTEVVPQYFGKFNTMEDVGTALNEGQSKITAQAEENKILKEQLAEAVSAAPQRDAGGKFSKKEDGTGLTDTPDNIGVEGILAQAGLENEAVVNQFLEHGELTDEQYNAFGKVTLNVNGQEISLSKELVDSHLHGGVAVSTLKGQAQQKYVDQATEMAGGQEQFQALIAHKNSLPDEQKAQFDALLENPLTLDTAMDKLTESRNAAIGATGSSDRVVGDMGATASTRGFANADEIRQAENASMQRYGPTFRKHDTEFMTRLANTPREVLTNLNG